MKRSSSFSFLLAIILTGVSTNWILTQKLPAKVATHFNFEGIPDGFMTIAGYRWFICIFSGIFPMFMLFMIGVVPSLFPGATNIPNRDYWFHPDRKTETMNYLFRMGCLLAGLMTLFFVGLNYVTVVANQNDPIRMPSNIFFIMLGTFLTGIGTWVFTLNKKFRRMVPARMEKDS